MRRRKTAIILCLFLGWIGVHRFYLGRLISGLVYLLTIGLFGIGWLIDLIALFCGGFAESFIHYTPRLSKLSIDEIAALSPAQFERFVGKVFAALGHEVELRGKPGDGGVDLIVRKDGKTAIVQCKRYQGTLSPAVLRDLYGTMQHLGADKGYLVTTGRLSSKAVAWVADKPITVIDRNSIHYWLRHADHAIKESGVQVPLYDIIDEPGWQIFAVLILMVLMLIFCICVVLFPFTGIPFMGTVKIVPPPTPTAWPH